MFTRLSSASFAVAALSVLVATGSARAADDTPSDACMQQAYDLSQEASNKELPAGAEAKLEGLFDLMVKHCKALELPQAKAVAEDIKKLIATAK